MMNRLWPKSLVTLAASGLFAIVAQAQLSEFNAINAAARAARERGDQAAVLANFRKLAAFIITRNQIEPGASPQAGIEVPHWRTNLRQFASVRGNFTRSKLLRPRLFPVSAARREIRAMQP
jgi:hypothetical protein